MRGDERKKPVDGDNMTSSVGRSGISSATWYNVVRCRGLPLKRRKRR